MPKTGVGGKVECDKICMKGPSLTASGHDASRLRAVIGSRSRVKQLNHSRMPVDRD
jgi:hypothetical protein